MLHIHDSQRRPPSRQDSCSFLPLKLWNLIMLFKPSSHRTPEFVADETYCLKGDRPPRPTKVRNQQLIGQAEQG